ncbi:MAG: hypothetical protein ABIJ09_06770 [Pseudomonadota bacterium]
MCALVVPARAATPTSLRSKLQKLEGSLVQAKAEVSALERELSSVLESSRLKCMEARAEGRLAEGAQCGAVEEKVSEGQILLDLGENDRAAIILYDVVTAPGFERSFLYEEAVSTLAEALYRSGNYIVARTYFRSLVQRGARLYAENSIQRLIEISGRLNDYGDLDSFFEAYRKMSGGSVRPEIAYVRAKSLIHAGRSGEALPLLEKIPRNHNLWMRAQYLSGVAVLAPGGEAALQQALDFFKRVGEQAPRDADEKEVRELGYLAQGRLYYELGDLVTSIDAYQNIPRDSEHFHDMLFEVAWAFIKRGQLLYDQPDLARAEFRKALQALDLIVAPGSRLEPEIAILRGNLLLRLSDYDEATSSFAEVVGRYQTTVDQLEALMAERGDASQLLEDILAADEKSLTVNTLLPPLAARWAQGQEEIDQALRVYKDLRYSKTELIETRKVIDKLRAALDSPNRTELLPAFGEIHTRGLNTYDALIGLRSVLVGVQGELLDATRIPGYAEVVERRKVLEKKFASIPKTREGLTDRMNRIAQRIEGLERDVFRLSLAIDEANAQIKAMEVWLVSVKQSGKLGAGEIELMNGRLAQARAEVEYLREEQQGLAELLKREHAQLTVSGGRARKKPRSAPSWSAPWPRRPGC